MLTAARMLARIVSACLVAPFDRIIIIEDVLVLADNPKREAKLQRAKQPAAKDGAQDADDDVADKAKAVAFAKSKAFRVT